MVLSLNVKNIIQEGIKKYTKKHAKFEIHVFSSDGTENVYPFY
jgi:hypothetical protein